MIEHEKEIFSRPARTWFQSGKDKAKSEGNNSYLCSRVYDPYNYERP
jgi:hypothetical protein